MSGYTKLFGSILDSTVWQTPGHVRLTWITMLAMADRDGVVEASVPGLAIRAGVSRPECEQALALFLAPDPDSRTPDFDGRRIEKVEGGWRVLNHGRYAMRMDIDDRRAKDAARQKRRRALLASRDKADASRDVTPVTTGHAESDMQTQMHTQTQTEDLTRRGGGNQVARARTTPLPKVWRPMLMQCVELVRDELRSELGERYRDFTLSCTNESCVLLETTILSALASSPEPHPPIEELRRAFVCAWLRERARVGGRLQLEYVLIDDVVGTYADEGNDFVMAVARRQPRGTLNAWRPKRKPPAPVAKVEPRAPVASPAEVAAILRSPVSRETEAAPAAARTGEGS